MNEVMGAGERRMRRRSDGRGRTAVDSLGFCSKKQRERKWSIFKLTLRGMS